MKLSICYLYPDLMNTYGDRGNIIALKRRAEWRGIEVEIKPITVGDYLDPKLYDFYFFGGGQDWQQIPVSNDLKNDKGKAILEALENGAVLLSICGGFQLLAEYYKPFDGEKLWGLGLFNAWTEAGIKRMIGNNVVQIDSNLFLSMEQALGKKNLPKTLVGFENHSGKTYLGKNCKPMGKSTVGYGNNGEDKLHGAIYRNAFGCYLHGSLLPKNPHFADYLLTLALKRTNGQFSKLSELDDKLELAAHDFAVERAKGVRFANRF